MAIYHYTKGICIQDILREGVIRPATEGVTGQERPAVWCTTNQDWEPLCNVLRMEAATGRTTWGSREESAEVFQGLYRIQIDPAYAPHNWTTHRRSSGATARLLRQLVKTARLVGSNEWDWRISYDPIPAAGWITVEAWDGEKQEWVTAAVRAEEHPTTQMEIPA